jgi:hypothetical protein
MVACQAIDRSRAERALDLLHHLDQTSSLFRLSPSTTVPGSSTTVNDHPVSGIGNSGGTAEEFVFDPEIEGCIHAMRQDPAIPRMLDHSSVLVPDFEVGIVQHSEYK